MPESRQPDGAATLPASASTAPPGVSPWPCFLTRSVGDSLPGTASPTKSPSGGWSRCMPDHHVSCQYALYSVPSSLCPPGQQVEIGLGSKLVRIYHRGKLVKVHQHQPKGGRATDPEDYPAESCRPTPCRAPDRDQEHCAAELRTGGG